MAERICRFLEVKEEGRKTKPNVHQAAIYALSAIIVLLLCKQSCTISYLATT